MVSFPLSRRNLLMGTKFFNGYIVFTMLFSGGMVPTYLLIKDLTSKVHDGKQYIRIAIRNDVDNNKMLEALKKELN